MWAIAADHDRGRHSNPYKHSNECFLCRVIVVRNTRVVRSEGDGIRGGSYPQGRQDQEQQDVGQRDVHGRSLPHRG